MPTLSDEAIPAAVLLDEPTAGMSGTETEQAIGLIRRLTANTPAALEADAAVRREWLEV